MAIDPLASELKSLNDRIYALERRGMYPPAVADSAWQVVGTAGQPAFTNSWTNWVVAPGWPTAAFRIDSEGWVQMRGLITGGLNATSAFTLPTAYRPAIAQTIRINSQDTAGHVVIDINGTVNIFGTALGFVGLGQISFPTWGRGDLRFDRIAAPPFSGDNGLRLPRIVLRRSGMYEMMGVTSTLVANVPEILNGIGPDFGDIYCMHGLTGQFVRLDIADNEWTPTGNLPVPAGGFTTIGGILGGIRWPSLAIEPDFINLPFAAGWSNFGWGGAHYWSNGRYYKDSNGYVHLRGLVTSSTNGAVSTITTLPAGFRPGGKTLCSSIANGLFCGIDVNTDGTVVTRNAPAPAPYVSLAGISFLAEN